MTKIRALLILTALAALAACGERSKFQSYEGTEVTRLILFKDERKLFLMHDDEVLREYAVGLGFAPDGHKEIEGDGRTPEGHYFINRRNPNSRFHLSIGISYPNEVDVARAQSLGKTPGGDIFIHGRGPTYWQDAPEDWTFGCVAVTDEEIETIYAMVRNGTPISIYPSRAHMKAEMKALRRQARQARNAPAAAPVVGTTALTPAKADTTVVEPAPAAPGAVAPPPLIPSAAVAG
ncbi:murein L,D-transpeptidase family protein [Palleronia sp.]|uniref:L,D-transpeptidase family protein n=1 Tax=Palleronia sp. TaxID=1940284 RepID=UPI0035C7AC70